MCQLYRAVHGRCDYDLFVTGDPEPSGDIHAAQRPERTYGSDACGPEAGSRAVVSESGPDVCYDHGAGSGSDASPAQIWTAMARCDGCSFLRDSCCMQLL